MHSLDLLLARAHEQGRPLMMGVLNVTPDSFSDGGQYLGEDAWRARVDALLDEGADVIDVGGESTRPGAHPVLAAEQCRRALGAVAYAARERGACVSIDTTDVAVARAALDAGARVVNDVSCLADPRLASAAADAGAHLVVMHSRGPMATMKGFSRYDPTGYRDVLAEVTSELAGALARAAHAGLPRDRVLVDPGLGFHKDADQSYALLASLADLGSRLAAPVVVGASRKSFLARDVATPPGARLGGTVAACLVAARQGAAVLRVHDVAAVRQALAVEGAAGRRGARRV